MTMTVFAPATAQQNEQFPVELIVDVPESYTSATIYLSYNPVMLRIDNVVPGAMMGGGHALVYNADTPGRVNIFIYATGAAPNIEPGQLCRVNVTALAEGSAVIGFVQHPRVPNPRIREEGIEGIPHTVAIAGVGAPDQPTNSFDAAMAQFLDISGLGEDAFEESDRFRVFAQEIHARGESPDNQLALDALLLARASALRGV